MVTDGTIGNSTFLLTIPWVQTSPRHHNDRNTFGVLRRKSQCAQLEKGL